jgi:hypothetical protein
VLLREKVPVHGPANVKSLWEHFLTPILERNKFAQFLKDPELIKYQDRHYRNFDRVSLYL